VAAKFKLRLLAKSGPMLALSSKLAQALEREVQVLNS
jgi:hypothetical protein